MLELADRTWEQAQRLARDPKTIVLLPLGAIEEHGPHLPLLVDWLGAQALAREIAPHLRRAGWRPLLAPSIPYGVSTLAARWSGTVSLPQATLRRLVVDIVRSLARHGFCRFVLTNYQLDPDHLRAMAAARRTLQRDRRLRVFFAGFAPDRRAMATMINPRVRALLRSPRPEREWHSGELETALVLALAPKLVRASARRLPPLWIDAQAAIRRGARRFEQIAPGGRGYFGWPAAARAVTGRRALALRGRLIARELLRALAGQRRGAAGR
jgi:creatinine amidohydrolase